MNQRVSGWLTRGLFIAGLLLIGLWFKNDTDARAFRSTETKKLETARRSGQSAHQPAPSRSRALWYPTTLESGVFGRIEIPRLRISALVAEGTQPAQLDRAVGHISTTAFPGRHGNCALAGHRDTFLRGLGDIREKDIIHVDTLQGTYTYEVEWSAVFEPRQVDVLDATAVPSLTLVTCYPFAFVGPAPERFVVRAKLVEAVADSSAIDDRAALQPGPAAEGR